MTSPTTNWPRAASSLNVIIHRCQAAPLRPPYGGFRAPGRRRAFTLIELMLVMALLIIALGISYPALRGFFRGRHLDSEGRRFLALVRYAQSQAISSGVPMQLWIDVRTASYGLEPYPGYIDANNTSFLYYLNDGLEIELGVGRQNVIGFNSLSMSGGGLGATLTSQPAFGAAANAQPAIGFRPDGTLFETSPAQLILRDEENVELWIVQSPARATYELIRPQRP